MGYVLVVLVVVLSAFNVGAIAFAGTTLAWRSMQWYFRLVLALIASLGLIAGLILSRDASLKALEITDVALFIAFHVLSLAAVVWTIIWLVRRKVSGMKSVLNGIAVACASIGAVMTLLWTISMIIVMMNQLQHPKGPFQ